MTTGGTAEDDTLTIPLPVTRTYPVDFADACNTQYPGSSLRWDPAYVYSWVCVGQAGRYYPPPNVTQQYLTEHGGYVASGLAAPSAGTLEVALSAGGTSASAARVAATRPTGSRVLIAVGRRTVGRRGRYSVTIKLTRAGRQLLARVHQPSVTVSVRFTPRGRHVRVSLSAKIVLG
jgi:hypothetical protein